MELIRTDLAKVIAMNVQPGMLAEIKAVIQLRVLQAVTRRLDPWSAPVVKRVIFAPLQVEHWGFVPTDPTPSRIGRIVSSALLVTAV